jgi:uncharacterized membrane protein
MSESTAPEKPLVSRRLHWLDIARGAALIAMASFHFMWDLTYFGYLEPDFPSAGWPRIYARSIASTFLFLAGFSLVLAHGNGICWASFRKRWAIVAGAAMLVSIATYFIIPDRFIYFGILHAIATASLVGLLFLRLPWPLTLAVAATAFAAPLCLSSAVFDVPWLWWIGLSTAAQPSFDYVPLLPWLAPFLTGIVVARLPVVIQWLRQNASGDKSYNWTSRAFSFLGRHSLVFYLVHQPVLLSILFGVSLLYPASGHPEFEVRRCVAGCVPTSGEPFCKTFCNCAVNALQDGGLLGSFQSGAISEAYQGEIDTIRSQCTVEARQP